MKKIFGILMAIVLISACNHDETNEEEALYSKVYKSDESVQCDVNSGIDLDVMKQELIDEGIDVICSQKLNDREARSAACGVGTGDINVYEINASNISDAENIGFNSVDDLSNYVDEKCE